MMMPNFLVILLAALVPMVMGFIWYNPKVLGTAWAKAAGVTEEKMKGGNMALIFIMSFVLSFLLAFGLQFMVIHQFHFYSILLNEPGLSDPNSEVGSMAAGFMEKYGHNFRTFKHGALHGTMGGILIAMPIIGTSAMFERKSFKYIAINAGYWIITMGIMGGILCQFS